MPSSPGSWRSSSPSACAAWGASSSQNKPAQPRHEAGPLGKILKGTTAMKTDMELQRDVLDEIAWEPSVAVPEIGVTVYDGIVTLSGSVDNLPAKWAAENAAL